MQVAHAFSADDPLRAFPTRDNTVEQRVKALGAAEKKTIRLPKNKGSLVFSITAAPAADDPPSGAATPDPWLRVFADGRADCGGDTPLQVERHEDMLAESELAWLLHLAVNECQILSGTTKDIEREFQQSGQSRSAPGEPRRSIKYYVELPAGKNELSIPERALVIRPLRGSLKLAAFASLDKYAIFLAARSHLGDPKERQVVLDQLNDKLKAEQPELPRFGMEDLSGAFNTKSVDLMGVFAQEIEVAPNKFKSITGNIARKEKGSPPTFSINVREFSKYRP